MGWLALCCVLTFALIVLGGVVRLSRAGLSITEWEPVSGVLPPIGEQAWALALAKYRATPEFAQVNSGIDGSQFRTIFLLEYAHRLLARITGLVVVAPLLIAVARRKLNARAAWPVLAVLGLGALQALLGWLMVKSGLVDVPHVSPYRLAAHLVTGIALFAAFVWMIATELLPPVAPSAPVLRWRLGATVVAALLTVTWGALMAGTHAGHVFPTFPKMGDAWLPIDMSTLLLRGATDPAAIHFLHRFLALALAGTCLSLAWAARRVAPVLAPLLVCTLAVQIGLGALVVLGHVSIGLASAHQANAIVVVGLLTALVRSITPSKLGDFGVDCADDSLVGTLCGTGSAASHRVLLSTDPSRNP